MKIPSACLSGLPGRDGFLDSRHKSVWIRIKSLQAGIAANEDFVTLIDTTIFRFSIFEGAIDLHGAGSEWIGFHRGLALRFGRICFFRRVERRLAVRKLRSSSGLVYRGVVSGRS